LVDSLKNQTEQDYELIVVDDFFVRELPDGYRVDRKIDIVEYLNKNGIKLSHYVHSKPKCFPDLAFNQCNQINTGLLLSQGDIIIIYDDYTWIPPDHLSKFLAHREKFEQNYCITPINRMWKDNRQRLEKVIIEPTKEGYKTAGYYTIYPEFHVGHPKDNNCVFDVWHKPEFFEVGGTAFPRSLLEEINGFPECYDCYPSGLWSYFTKKAGDRAKYFVDHNIVCEMIDHRGWKPEYLWHCAKMEPHNKSTDFIDRENCFNLKEAVYLPPRGDENYDEFYGKYYEISLERIKGTTAYRKIQNYAGKPIDYKDKIVLDVGADYGSTASFFLEKGAKQVIAIESEDNDFKRLEKYARSETIIPLNISIDNSQQFENLLRTYKPNIVKMDCEGCERALFDVPKDAGRIPELYVMELHPHRVPELWQKLRAYFKNCGFSIISILYWARTYEMETFERTDIPIIVAARDWKWQI